jgi:hypothetical protein
VLENSPFFRLEGVANVRRQPVGSLQPGVREVVRQPGVSEVIGLDVNGGRHPFRST